MSTVTRHKLLQRLIAKHLEPGLGDDPRLQDLLEALDRTLHGMDKERELTEHAFQVSEREYQELLRQVERENRERRQGHDQLQTVLRTLLNDPSASLEGPISVARTVDLLRELAKRANTGH